ncbi:MAG: AbrB/MazE/SpoVT family DNA-binding domain-containing protein [Kiritimatiellae bacterium]|nr:AbrB/MazE/SpoVT family DNA-binding domain-containing protein [Kiritimatiellia bacterium]
MSNLSNQAGPAAVRKIGVVGRYSYCVTIPGEVIQALRWRVGQKVVVSRGGDAIVIRDWKKPARG